MAPLNTYGGGFCFAQSPPPQNKPSVNWCNGISVYSVELLSMFKCLKDFFACQDERSMPVYYQTPLSPFLSGLGCMKDRLQTVVLLECYRLVDEFWERRSIASLLPAGMPLLEWRGQLTCTAAPAPISASTFRSHLRFAHWLCSRIADLGR